MRYVRIYSDDAGESHFDDLDIALAPRPYAPPSAPFDVSAPISASGAVLFSMPAGWFGDWHPSPRRQLYFNLSGQLEVVVSDGEARQLGPGDIVLVEDVSGDGHTTRAIGEEPSTGVFVHLADDEAL